MTYTPGLNGGRINATISGNTAGAGALVSTGTMTLAGGNNITLSQAGNAITISGAAGGGAGFTAGMSNIGNTSGTSGTVSNQLIMAGGNNVTLSQSTGAGGNTITVSAASQTVQTQNILNGFSVSGISTSGTLESITSGGLFIYGSFVTQSQNSISLGMASPYALSAGMSGGNTSGAGNLAVNKALYFAGGNNITLSNSNAIDGGFGVTQTITISAANQTNQTMGIYAASNTTQSTSATVDARSMTFAGAGVASVGASNGSVVISVPSGGGGGGDLDYYQNMDRGTSAALGTAHRTLMLQRLNQENNVLGHNVTANTFLINMSGNMTATSLSSSHSYTLSVGVYLDQVTRLSLVNSASTSWGFTAATSNTANYHGPRWISFVSSQWSSAPNFASGNDYVFGLIANSSNYGAPLSYIGQNYMVSAQRSGTLGTTVATNTSLAQGNYWNAMFSATQSSLPSTIASNAVNRNNATAIFMPHIILNNRYSGTF